MGRNVVGLAVLESQIDKAGKFGVETCGLFLAPPCGAAPPAGCLRSKGARPFSKAASSFSTTFATFGDVLRHLHREFDINKIVLQ